MTVPTKPAILLAAIALMACFQTTHAATTHPRSVTGTVFNDANNSGFFDSGEQVVGINVALFEDDGNGLFDPFDDTFVVSELTDTNGLYSFGDLDLSSNYFVLQAAQTVDGISFTESVSGLLTASDFMTILDDFASQQEVSANPRVPVGSTNLTSSTVLGGQRDLHVRYISGPAESTLYANPFGLNQVLEFNQSAAVMSVATITWDGIDGDFSTTPQPGGLGGFDLTDNGRNEAFSFAIGIDAAGEGDVLTLRIFSEDGVSTATVEIPVTNGTALETQTVAFSDFVGDADLTAIDAVQLELGGLNPSIDMQIGPIELVRSAVNDFSVAAVPEPSSALMSLFGTVWLLAKRRRRR